MKKVFLFLLKDIKNEYRTKELFSSMFTFALVIILIFNFSFNISRELLSYAVPSFMWICFTFAGLLGLSRSFGIEKENEAIKGVLLSPTSPVLIYISKFLSNFLFLFILELILLPLFIVFFNYDISGSILVLYSIIITGTIGFVSVGTLFSTMSVNTRLREVILPILLFPIIIPLLINSVRVTFVILNGQPLDKVWYSIKLIIAFDIMFLFTSAIVYGYVLEED